MKILLPVLIMLNSTLVLGKHPKCSDENYRKSSIGFIVKSQIQDRLDNDGKAYLDGKYEEKLCSELINSGKYQRALNEKSDCANWDSMFESEFILVEIDYSDLFQFDLGRPPLENCKKLQKVIENKYLKEKIELLRDDLRTKDKKEVELEMISSDDKEDIRESVTPMKIYSPANMMNKTNLKDSHSPERKAGSGAVRQ